MFGFPVATTRKCKYSRLSAQKLTENETNNGYGIKKGTTNNNNIHLVKQSTTKYKICVSHWSTTQCINFHISPVAFIVVVERKASLWQMSSTPQNQHTTLSIAPHRLALFFFPQKFPHTQHNKHKRPTDI